MTKTLEKEIRGMAGSLGDKIKPLELLTELEKKIEEQIFTISNNIKPEVRAKAESNYFDQRRNDNIEEMKKIQAKISKVILTKKYKGEEKKEKIMGKGVEKRQGRRIMARNFIDDGKNEASTVDPHDQEAIEYERYFT